MGVSTLHVMFNLAAPYSPTARAMRLSSPSAKGQSLSPAAGRSAAASPRRESSGTTRRLLPADALSRGSRASGRRVVAASGRAGVRPAGRLSSAVRFGSSLGSRTAVLSWRAPSLDALARVNAAVRADQLIADRCRSRGDLRPT